MESKINYEAIEAYSKSLSKKISQEFFNNHEIINGYQILEVSPIKQLNLMVIKLIFNKWKQETARLQSPYFDYNHKEVKLALNDFMNTLSKHIALKREHFEPLMGQSVRECLLLICAPYDFYSKEINRKEQSRISLDELKDLSRYIKINTHLLRRLIVRFEEEKLDRIFNDEAFELFNEVCEQTTEGPEDIEGYISQFNTLIPLTLDKVYGAVPPKQVETADKKISEQPKKEQKDTAGKPSINDKLAIDTKTISEKIAGQKTKSIEQALTLNQRIMFVKQLFGGEAERFNAAIRELDQQANYNTAAETVKAKWAKSEDWDMDSEEVIEFMEMLANRYA